MTKDELRADIERRFTYYPPKGDQAERYARINKATKDYALLIAELTPYSKEQSIALTELFRVRMMANASIAINE